MKSKLKHVKDQDVLDFWTKEYPNSQRSSESGEVTSWVVSKFGPFMSNTMMRNIMGQTKSGFNLRDIMDNNKILIVNLSQGKMGELNSRLIGMIFVMKFQAAVMSRDNILEDQREDFCLYVDEFQNFATDSFESMLSQVRKYRLNMILGNQFMTQLSEKVREAIIGNVGTVISGRIGTTDAELLVKRFEPTFDAQDMIKLPNYQSIANVMINNTPSAPFSMSWLPPLGGAHANPDLADAMKKLSAAKYGRPRSEVEQEIFSRLGASTKPSSNSSGQLQGEGKQSSSSSSFLDEWLEKRKKISQQKPQPSKQGDKNKKTTMTMSEPKPAPEDSKEVSIDKKQSTPHTGSLSIQDLDESDDNEVHIAIR